MKIPMVDSENSGPEKGYIDSLLRGDRQRIIVFEFETQKTWNGGRY